MSRVRAILAYWRFLLLVTALGVAVILTVSVALSRFRQGWPTSPWFGRGGSLPKLPYTVVVGPVDAIKGIPGLVEIGMPRASATANLGPPLIAGMPAEEARERGFFDPGDVSADFVGGVFAWVQYGTQRRVISITFDLRAFARKFAGTQKVLLMYRGRTYLLDGDLTRSKAIAMFGARPRGPKVRLYGPDLVIEGTGASLQFDFKRHRLTSVSICALSQVGSPEPRLNSAGVSGSRTGTEDTKRLIPGFGNPGLALGW